MAALPDYVKILLEDAGEEFDPGVVVSEMEKGLAKQRVGSARVVVDMAATLQFYSTVDTLAFEDWYFNTIKRIGFFDVKDPRTGLMRPMRFKGGSIGRLEPLVGKYVKARRAVTLEYLR